MPIYEYQCDGCSYRFEVKQSIKDDPLSTCDRCGNPVRRLISSPGIMFKGSGWYITDYSDKMKPKSGDSKDSPAEAKKETAGSSAGTASTSTTSSAQASPSSGASSSGSSSSSS